MIWSRRGGDCSIAAEDVVHERPQTVAAERLRLRQAFALPATAEKQGGVFPKRLYVDALG